MNMEEKAKLLRTWILKATTAASSGHPTSCLSSADIMTVLFDKYFTYDLSKPDNLNNDRFILSKGHAAPLLYTLFAMSGAFPLEHLLTLRQIGSDLEGHPTRNFKYADAATGSLGQGLSIGAGIAYGLDKLKNDQLLMTNDQRPARDSKVFVLLGDGEMAEGQIWEAANFASYYKLHSVIAIVDVNHLGQSQETMFGKDAEAYVSRLEAFGWMTISIDGHDFTAIDRALSQAVENASDKPIAIIASTVKGKGVSFLENKQEWHGKALKPEELDKALAELGPVDDSLRFDLPVPPLLEKKDSSLVPPSHISYTKGSEVATREAYGQTLAAIMKVNTCVFALDADLKNSTFSKTAFTEVPDQSLECFIAEQNMVSVAVGLSRVGIIPAVSTFGAFLTRATDQIRMASLSQSRISFCGSHNGVSMGEDGPSQMGLDDIALFSDIQESIIVHPSDAISASALFPQLIAEPGITYFRTLRAKTPMIYDDSQEFHIGGSHVLRSSPEDMLTIVCMGITVHEALKAYDILQQEHIFVRILDCYSVKPIDTVGLLTSLKSTKKSILLTVEDHFPHGGLRDFVLEATDGENATVVSLAVMKQAHSGKPEDVLHFVGIDAEAIVARVRQIAQDKG